MWIPIEVSDEIVQRRIQTSSQTIDFCRIDWPDIAFQPGAVERVAHLIERSPADFEIPSELRVRRAAKSFRDVSAGGIDSVLRLRSMLEIIEKRRPAREPENDGPQRVGELPHNQLRIVPCNRHPRIACRDRSADFPKRLATSSDYAANPAAPNGSKVGDSGHHPGERERLGPRSDSASDDKR
jgi:hypothetical protein